VAAIREAAMGGELALCNGREGHVGDGRPATSRRGTAVTALFRLCANACDRCMACYSVSAE
jgi:hypothetical protein